MKIDKYILIIILLLTLITSSTQAGDWNDYPDAPIIASINLVEDPSLIELNFELDNTTYDPLYFDMDLNKLTNETLDKTTPVDAKKEIDVSYSGYEFNMSVVNETINSESYTNQTYHLELYNIETGDYFNTTLYSIKEGGGINQIFYTIMEELEIVVITVNGNWHYDNGKYYRYKTRYYNLTSAEPLDYSYTEINEYGFNISQSGVFEIPFNNKYQFGLLRDINYDRNRTSYIQYNLPKINAEQSKLGIEVFLDFYPASLVYYDNRTDAHLQVYYGTGYGGSYEIYYTLLGLDNRRTLDYAIDPSQVRDYFGIDNSTGKPFDDLPFGNSIILGLVVLAISYRNRNSH